MSEISALHKPHPQTDEHVQAGKLLLSAVTSYEIEGLDHVRNGPTITGQLFHGGFDRALKYISNC